MRDEVGATVPGTATTTRAGTPGAGPARRRRAVFDRGGVGSVHPTGICTVEDAPFFSYRRTGVTGRFAGCCHAGRRD